ncbi:hypothetical protein A2619_01160 [candidate division WWE3 bacterium RIFOXYD1_FULL_39_9]|uniref:Uncharacterized protein n=1 Tax=candidate division WWE3 bacterium RIFOXYD1_FULL_39_9 TaxID=1802649 RepID=A0A1F4X690_UNCKA|nr:MAG: hypothetical protein A2619_01160 [candidate division WWE3 bacterium RIFOXYD1_FULL_39_9]
MNLIAAKIIQKINGWEQRRNTLQEIYNKEGRNPTLIEIENANKVIEKLNKELKRTIERVTYV